MVRFAQLPPDFWREFKQWRSVTGVLSGESPPGNFVGSVGYPVLNVGALTTNEDAQVLDSPEAWYRMGLGQWDIVKFRMKLVLARTKVNVKDVNNPLVRKIQELSISRKPVDVEVRLRGPAPRLMADGYHAPLGVVAIMDSLRITSNVSAERVVERLINDADVDARTAVIELYRAGIPISRIQRMFSVGLLGNARSRRLVPTRWSITAVDSIVGDELRSGIKDYDWINNYEIHRMSYMGNNYVILLIPGPWSYELIEVKMPGSVWNRSGDKPRIYVDREGTMGMRKYAEETGGAFYAIRLGVLEYLERIRRQATVVAIREVTPDYKVPVGIWQAREAVRNGMGKDVVRFSDLNEAINYTNQVLITRKLWTKYTTNLRQSRLM
ncbi:Nre family DNA repair protein [Vulcanisaeta thermophila]|uniref:Nre family DNA repair protein n=1 Tax=Vulcanisaeta thermophila TaxID=867917 RepID=UPI000853945B|nr:Nre family DNA repair protein [Vulcanisaeta thermophila]